jgi:hypothetical protein
MPRARSLAAVVSACALCHCGGRVGGAASADDGGTGGQPAVDAAPSGPYRGFVSADVQASWPPARAFDDLQAYFYLASEDTPPPQGKCPEPVGASCCLATSGGDAGAPPALPPFASAGTIQITTGGAPVATMQPQNGYENMTAAWSPGAALDVAASGAEVPAFHVTLPTPGPFVGLVPAFNGGGPPLVVDRTKDLAVGWTPEGHAGEIVAVIMGGVGAALGFSCHVDDSAGGVTLPAAALARLPANTTVQVVMLRALDATAEAGGTKLTLSSSVLYEGGVTTGP